MLELWQCREGATDWVLQQVTFTLMTGRGKYPGLNGSGKIEEGKGKERLSGEDNSMDEDLKMRDSMNKID